MPDEEQIKALLRMFPNLDRLMCETLLNTPPEKLQELLAKENESKTPDSYVLQTVHVE